MNEICYISKKENFGVRLSKNIYLKLLSECKKAGSFETGGILIGNYSIDRKWADIFSITGSTMDSKKGFFNFFRGTFGLKSILDREWRENNHYYIGEWHYHPNATSDPSIQDIKQMIEFSCNPKLKCPEPILLIVGGNETGWNLSVSVFLKKNEIKLSIV